MSIDQVDRLKQFELLTLGRFLLHHMSQDTRKKLMEFSPVIYRKITGKGVSDLNLRELRSIATEDDDPEAT